MSLRKVAGGRSTTLFDYEFALDMFYFRDLWKRCQKRIEKRRPGSSAGIGGCYNRYPESAVDLPCKRYYGMKAADVYALIIPVHYRLNLEQVKRMAEAEHRRNVELRQKETRYGKYLQEMEKPNLERVGSMIQENVHRALMRQNPYSATCLEVYLYRGKNRKCTGSSRRWNASDTVCRLEKSENTWHKGRCGKID